MKMLFKRMLSSMLSFIIITGSLSVASFSVMTVNADDFTGNVAPYGIAFDSATEGSDVYTEYKSSDNTLSALTDGDTTSYGWQFNNNALDVGSTPADDTLYCGINFDMPVKATQIIMYAVNIDIEEGDYDYIYTNYYNYKIKTIDRETGEFVWSKAILGTENTVDGNVLTYTFDEVTEIYGVRVSFTKTDKFMPRIYELEILGTINTIDIAKFNLKTAINYCLEFYEGNYTAESWAELTAVVENGKAILATDSQLETEYADAATAVYSAITNLVKIPSVIYDDETKIVSGIMDRTTVGEIKGITGAVNLKGNPLSDEAIVGTGMSVTKDSKTYTVMILGDVSGDGAINSTDFMQVQRAYLNIFELGEINSLAADVNCDEKINSTDFMQIRKHYLGLYDIFASKLKGKAIFFLGSSVTYGSASGGVSMADIIAENNDCKVIKEAVSGTTLVDNGATSYVQRLQKEGYKSLDLDCFVCQLSTNDATGNKPLGKLSDSFNRDDFDTTTVIGAIEFIVSYAKETWNCPVVFYTGTKYNSTAYENMINALYDVKEKWDIGIIDLWNDAQMNGVSDENYSKYMSDPIHPTEQGYREWWTPKFEEFLKRFI